jgi:predicted ester cyclase
MRRFLEANAKTFPDERVAIERMTVEGDTVAFRGTYAGTQEGAIGPFPPTNRAIQVDVAGTFRIEGERIAELWVLWDNLALLGQLGLWPPVDPEPPASGGDAAERMALGRVWFEEVINERNLDAIDEHYAEDYVHHGTNGAEIRGIEGARAFAASILSASADRVAVVEQQVSEGDLVVTRFVSRGTHTGAFRGMEPTGKEWVTEGICISRIEGGKIAEDWEIVHHSGF